MRQDSRSGRNLFLPPHSSTACAKGYFFVYPAGTSNSSAAIEPPLISVTGDGNLKRYGFSPGLFSSVSEGLSLWKMEDMPIQ